MILNNLLKIEKKLNYENFHIILATEINKFWQFREEEDRKSFNN